MNIIIDKENVTMLDIANSVGRIEELVTREEFEETYGVDLSGVHSLSYEPDRGIYHLETAQGVSSFGSADENQIIKSVADKESVFTEDIQIKYLNDNKPSDYHTLNTELKKWEITESNQALLDADNARTQFKNNREDLISNLKVTVDNMEFDADETALKRLNIALSYSDSKFPIRWNLADNTQAQITKTQIQEVIDKAGDELDAIWFE